MRRVILALGILALSLVAIGQARRRPATPTPAPVAPTPAVTGAALDGLTTAQLASFNAGQQAFTRRENVASGLGPVFNDDACSQCHNAGAVGGGSNRTVTRFARRTNGVFDPLTTFGGTLLQNRAIGGPNNGGPAIHTFVAERVPAEATIVTQRRTTPLFGLGLVDATPDNVFVTLAAAEAARGNGTGGRVNLTDNVRAGMKTAGRFGWKAQVPTLVQFTADALVNEEGITNPDFPSENCPQGNCAELAFNPAPGLNDPGTRVASINNYMQMLAAPARGTQSADSIAGEQVFSTIGCTDCHVATLTSGASSIAALDRKTYHPYSDFLLHDMGTLGDGIEMGSATGSEVRTAPLWGLRFVTRYLHDGRATTLQAAIAAHDGQGRTSRDRFNALTATAQAQLLAFLRSL